MNIPIFSAGAFCLALGLGLCALGLLNPTAAPRPTVAVSSTHPVPFLYFYDKGQICRMMPLSLFHFDGRWFLSGQTDLDGPARMFDLSNMMVMDRPPMYWTPPANLAP